MHTRAKTEKGYSFDGEELGGFKDSAQTRIATIRPSVRDSDRHADALLTVEDVAELLRVPVSWVYERTRARSANRIPGFRLGKYWRFREADVLAWLEQQGPRVKTSG